MSDDLTQFVVYGDLFPADVQGEFLLESGDQIQAYFKLDREQAVILDAVANED